MRRAELAEQLERLGSYPTPLPDPRRVEEWERELYREFTVQPVEPAARRAARQARRRRRQVLVGSLAMAAAVSVAAFLLQRDSTPGVSLDAASGAFVLLPDGSTRPLHAGDQIPAHGVVRTGRDGSVTIDGTTVGAGQALIYDDGRVILLPVPSTSGPPDQVGATDAPTTAASPSSSAGPASSQVPGTNPQALPPPKPANLPSAPPVTTPPAAPAAPTASPLAPSPAAAALPQLQLTVTRANEGVHLSWTTTDSPTFERYVVVRGPAAAAELTVIAELPDRQITSFTDPAAPISIDLVYRVLALDAEGRPIAISGTAMLEIGVASTDPTTTVPDSTGPPVTEPPATDPGTTAPPATDPGTTAPSTDPPATDPAATDPPATDPAATDPPATDPSPTNPPSTDAPITDPPVTDAP
jgi:hypothetical protein